MKIGHPVTPPLISTTSPDRAAQSDAGKPVISTTGTEASAQVALSSTASSLRAGAAAPSGDFDAEKVARISAAIEKGTFKVNHEAIADKLIANAQELLTKATR